MDDHIEGADQRSTSAYQYVEPTGVEIYGSPIAKSLSMIQEVVADCVSIVEYPDAIGWLF